MISLSFIILCLIIVFQLVTNRFGGVLHLKAKWMFLVDEIVNKNNQIISYGLFTPKGELIYQFQRDNRKDLEYSSEDGIKIFKSNIFLNISIY